LPCVAGDAGQSVTSAPTARLGDFRRAAPLVVDLTWMSDPAADRISGRTLGRAYRSGETDATVIGPWAATNRCTDDVLDDPVEEKEW
jgi:hypothetical protein